MPMTLTDSKTTVVWHPWN